LSRSKLDCGGISPSILYLTDWYSSSSKITALSWSAQNISLLYRQIFLIAKGLVCA